MRIALIAPPFIAVPPKRYGGTELFVADLAAGLVEAGHHVIVYANGDSSPAGELRWMFRKSEWPIADAGAAAIKEITHLGWACQDAARRADVIHVNSGLAVPFSRYVEVPFVATLHHPADPALSALYAGHPDVSYVAISRAQQAVEALPRITTVHHGLDLSRYRFVSRKQPYLAFLGRICESKGTHLAIQAARLAGMPLKIAGEVQPAFQDYWEAMVKPEIDGRQIEYVGEADLSVKNELLGNAAALLFPIQWNEPFGLVMIEAMACGTPVLAFGSGSVPEIVSPGIGGWICRDVAEMAERARDLRIDPSACRGHVARYFSVPAMASGYEQVYAAAVQAGAARRGQRFVAELDIAGTAATKAARPPVAAPTARAASLSSGVPERRS